MRRAIVSGMVTGDAPDSYWLLLANRPFSSSQNSLQNEARYKNESYLHKNKKMIFIPTALHSASL